MINRLTLILLLAFLWSNNHAQVNKKIDSLKHELARARYDTSRVMIMANLCSYYRFSYQDSALFYGQKAYALATKVKFNRGVIYALGVQSFALLNSGDLPKALEVSFKASQLGKEYHLEGRTSPALSTIGDIYFLLGDYPKALKYYRMQQAASVNGPDKAGYGFSFLAIGEVLMKMNKLDSVPYYLQMANLIFSKRSAKTQVMAKYGDMEMMRGNYPLALDYYRKSLHLAQRNNEPRTSANIQNALSKFYKTTNQRDSAIAHAKRGLAEAELFSLKRTILQSALLLSELYEPIDAQEALRYYKLSITTKEGLTGGGNMQAIQTMITRDEERRKEIEAAKMAYQNQLKQYGLIGGLVMVLIIAFILYLNNRRKQKANALLHQQKEEIQSTLTQLKATQSQLIQSEKMASLGELTAGIAHEIQNPLNFVNNFSEVNSELIAEMKNEIEKGNLNDVKTIANNIDENEQKIIFHGKRADTIVKGMLLHSRSSSGQKDPTDVNALADEYLRLAYHGLRARDKSFNATMKTDFDESIGNINIVPQDIGRVILNLITNAFYAVNEKSKRNISGYEPTVIVSTRRTPLLGRGVGGEVMISVKDNGGGISHKVLDKIFQPFFTTKPTGQGTGLGLSLSYDIVRAHGGELRVATLSAEAAAQAGKEARPDDPVGRGEGSEFIIELPNV